MYIELPLVLPQEEEVLSAIGGPRVGSGSAGEALAEARKSIAQALGAAPDLAHPVAVYEVVAVDGVTDMDGVVDIDGAIATDDVAPSAGLLLRNGETIPCDAERFRGVEKLAITVATLGPQLEQEVTRRCADGDMLSALALDCIGTLALRAAGSALHKTLARIATDNGHEIGGRISPGCELVPIEAQRAVFATARPDIIGVALSDSMVMTPVKTISSLFPIAVRLPAWIRSFDACAGCAHRSTCVQVRL